MTKEKVEKDLGRGGREKNKKSRKIEHLSGKK